MVVTADYLLDSQMPNAGEGGASGSTENPAKRYAISVDPQILETIQRSMMETMLKSMQQFTEAMLSAHARNEAPMVNHSVASAPAEVTKQPALAAGRKVPVPEDLKNVCKPSRQNT